MAATLLVSCESENLYDIASYDGRTAYAMVYNGTTYRLIIANLYFDKIFTTSFIFDQPFSSISANRKHIIACDYMQIYKACSNLTEWLPFAPKPPSLTTPTLEYNDTFIVTDNNKYPSILDMNTLVWTTPYGTLSCDTLFIGYDGNVYAFVNTSKEFYLLGSTANSVTGFDSFSPNGLLISGYRTKNYFYVWYTGGNNSIFRTNGSSETVFNSSTTWAQLVDVAINDNDELFAVVEYSANNYVLIQINAVDDFTTLLTLGNNGTFKINFLDNGHLIFASYGNTNGYNGLFIYNINDNKIERFITIEDVASLYVTK